MKKFFNILVLSVIVFANASNASGDSEYEKYINVINPQNCDQILTNDGFFKSCYDYELKGTIYSYAKLDGEKINYTNLKQHPKFHTDLSIPRKFQTRTDDYTRTGFDRGHIQSDASWDWSKKSQLATYSMSNISPQFPRTNRHSYLLVEDYERLIASKLGLVESLTKIYYSKNPKRFKKSGIAIPEGFGKVYWNSKINFKRCFYIPNDNREYRLKEMEISCENFK